MRDVVHHAGAAIHHIDDRRVGIDAQILCNLVVGTLNEGAGDRPHGAESAFGHA